MGASIGVVATSARRYPGDCSSYARYRCVPLFAALATGVSVRYGAVVDIRRRQLDVVFQPVMQSISMRQLDRVVRLIAAKDVIVTFMG